MFKFIKLNNRGQSLVELLIAIGLAAILLPAILAGISASREGRAQHDQRVEAISMVKNAQEAVRSIIQRDWNLANTNGTYHPEILGNVWVLTAGTQSVNGFTSSVVISDVYRDTNGVIVTSGGALDPSTKKFVTTVSWTTPLAEEVSSLSYFTRHKNAVNIDTTQAEFNQGTTNPVTTGIAVTNTSGGEVTLGAGGGGGDWCQPSLSMREVNLPKNGVANAISAIEGKVFAGTGENASGVSFAKVGLDMNHPPNATISATFDGFKTNGVFGESNYAYLATDTNSKEIVIINLTSFSDPPTNSKYSEAGYFNAPGNGSGNSIFVSGNYGYMTSGNKFYIFDLSSKSGSRTQVNSSVPTLAGTGVKISVVGNYAYVATTSTSNQLQIIDISNKTNPSIVSSPLSINAQAGKDLFVNDSGTRAYLATGASASKSEFFIINTSNKTNPTLVTGGTFDTNGMDPKGVTVVTGNRAIIVGTGGTTQYQVININNENSPTVCGNGLAIATGVNGVSSVLQSDGYAYSYIITGDSASELKIILGGAGAGSNYNSAGVFESRTFDGGSEVTWNRLSVNSSIPQHTTLQFRVGIKPGISNNCSAVTFANSDFVGMDGQSTGYFPGTGGVIPFQLSGSGFRNPGRCARYRAYFSSSDSTQTPVINDVNLNYSP
jgi:type II secretory pathway pseudopilin PulG